MSSSTSNSRWRKYWISFLRIAAGVSMAIYLIIILIDPFDTIFFSPTLDRAPMATNQRFSYPAIARNPSFDSAVIGSSSVRLLNPEILNKEFSAHFVNLAMNAATPFEQYRMFQLFLKYHPEPKILIFGIDIKNQNKWCQLDTLERFTEREFPEWMYDDNRWNDVLYHFNAKALEITGRQIGQLLGVVEPRFGRNGFNNFTPDIKEYDLNKARHHIYGESGKPLRAKVPMKPELSEKEIGALYFPSIYFLEEMLKTGPTSTIKIVHIPPRPWLTQPVANTKDALVLQECRSRIINISKAYPNVHVFDFSIESPITAHDSNFWDEWHHNIFIADNIIHMIGGKLLKDSDKNEYYRYY